MMKFLLLTISLFLFVQFGFAQKTTLERITHEDGLPSDMVKTITMDSDGFIWAGTDDGVVKIEGANFVAVAEHTNFFDMYKDMILSKKFGLVASTDSGMISINQVYDGIHSKYLKNSFSLSNFQHFQYSKNIFESNDSSLWVSFPGQLVRIKNNEVSVLDFPKKNHTYNFFRSYQMIEAGNNHFYILSQKGYLYALNTENNEITEIAWRKGGTEIFSVCKISNQQFLIGCGVGILQMNFENGLFKDVIDLGFNFPVSVIAQKDKNHFVLGTWSDGAYEFSLGKGKPTYSLLQGSDDQEIYDILFDNQNQVWLATSSGLFVYRNLVFNYPFKDISYGNIKNITPGPDGSMYFSRGDIVYCVDNEQRVQKYFQSRYGEIASLAINQESLLIGTIKGYIVCKKFMGETFIHDFSNNGKEIYSLAIDRNADIWFLQAHPSATKLLKINKKGEVLNLSPERAPVGNYNLNAIKTVPNGDVYIAAGGINHYLYKYNYEKGIVENISIPIKELGSRLLWTYDFSIINSQTLLLATQNGVYKYQSKSMKHYDLGFQTNKVAIAVASDNLGRIWISAHNGILCYDKGTTTLYNEADGLLNKFVNSSCFYIDSKNMLWVGTHDGMVLSNIPDEMKPSAQPIISSLKKSGIPIQIVGENSFLQHSLLNFTFASPDYPAKYILYQYSLNKDNGTDYWKDIEKKKDYLIFDTLKKGNYTLKVRAKTKGHYRWSNPVIYKFSIYKIWYTRPEIIMAINFLLIILVFLYLRYNRKKSVKEKERLEKIISIRTLDLIEQNKRLVKTQQQLIQSEKMATVGLLAAGIAHEINNPVNYINGGILVLRKSFNKFKSYFNAYKELLNKSDIDTPGYPQLPDEQQIETLLESSEEMFKTIEEGIDKTTKIVQSIRVFSSNSEHVFVELDINEMLDYTIKIVAKNYKDRIEIIKEYTPKSKIIGVSVNIQQVFVNLLTNAIQAIPAKGTIWIKTQQNNEQKTMIISIKDNGIGIDQKIKEKIFDPFFSTKDVGKGTGLGLYLTYRYIEQHHGTIKVFSEPGKGTEFIISLPLTKHENG